MSEHLGVLCIKQLETDLFMEIWNKGDVTGQCLFNVPDATLLPYI